jgi:hypothetical protein
MEKIDSIREKYKQLEPVLNEQTKRLWAATEAKAIGYGGVRCLNRITGLSRTTILAGLQELESGVQGSRQRSVGGGRKKLIDKEPTLMTALKSLVEPYTQGDPCSPLRWVCKSTGNLAEELGKQGYKVSPRTVAGLLADNMGYSLQSPRKSKAGKSNPDRNAQFVHINSLAASFMQENEPVVSVDTKKKELVGNFKNSGQEWRPKGNPTIVNDHDFLRDSDGKAIPYGVFDLGRNEGWVNVGQDHDTPEFAVTSIRQWWENMGSKMYPNAKKLLITADAGGSNGYRVRAWKLHLQKLATETGLEINVCHFPPGTSKWNKIEHRLFCHITRNWRGRTLTTYETIVNLIANTTTSAGLRVQSKLDNGKYPTGEKVSKKQFDNLNMEKDDFHGEWNYKLQPMPE